MDPFASLFPFSPHWPVRQICRGHGGMPAVTFGRAAARKYSALAGNISPSVDALPKSKLWLIPLPVRGGFTIPPWPSCVGLYQQAAEGVATRHKTKCSFCTKKQGMGLYKSMIYFPLSSLNSYYIQPRIVFIENGYLRKHFEAEAWPDALNVF